MSGSDRVFRGMLCESRAHPVESTDPTKARTIDELKRQLKETKAELDGERVKSRQLLVKCEKDVRRAREEGEKKIFAALEALSVRKDQDKMADVKRIEEKIRREYDIELKGIESRKNEEFLKAQKKWLYDKDEEVKKAVRDERERCLRDSSVEIEEVSQKEEKLTRELFQLSQTTSQLEDQIYHLGRENKTQIEQMRRMKHEHELEIADIIRQQQTEASRDYAQLRLAEQILAEREADLHMVESRAEKERVEREQLVEEVSAMKSVLNTSSMDQTESPKSSRKSVGGVLSRRVDDLETSLKKLEDERSQLKQENASLRKKMVQDSPGAAKDDDKTRKLRKRNTELVSLIKTLDEKYKTLKSDYEQLQKPTPTDSETQLRKTLNRQHAKDIMEYTKQIHAKEREIGELKRKISKFEVGARVPSEAPPELEKKLKILSMDRLKMEKIIAKLCSKVPEEEEEVTAVLSRTELECETSCVEALDIENQKLKKEIATLQEREQVDSGVDIESLKREAAMTAKLRDELSSLKRAMMSSTSSRDSELEQRCHTLTQQLQVSQMAVEELQSNADHVTELESQVTKLTNQARDDRQKVDSLKEQYERVREELSDREDQISLLQEQLNQKDHLSPEKVPSQELTERAIQTSPIKTAPEAIQTSPIKTAPEAIQTSPIKTAPGAIQTSPITTAPGAIQTSPITTAPGAQSTPLAPADGRANHILTSEMINSDLSTDVADGMPSEGRGNPYTAPPPLSRDLLDTSLDNEMKAVGVVLPDPYDSGSEASTEEPTTRSEELKSDHEQDDDDTFHTAESTSPAVFIAKFSYNPSEQSPNPVFDMELPLTAGDTVYVYGGMDGDGFYHGKLENGSTGLIPSNFVERVSDDHDGSVSRRGPRKLSQLQDIVEEDEDTDSTGSQEFLEPPSSLEVDKQFVDGGGTSVALSWGKPHPFPTSLTGYAVYVNGDHKASIEGPDSTSVLITDVPLTQLVRITVRSVLETGESPDNTTPVILNPQYPDPPSCVTVTPLDSPRSLLVNFSPHHSPLTPISRYTLYLNTFGCTSLEVTESTAEQQTISMIVLPRDVDHLAAQLMTATSVRLSITASNEDYESMPSDPVSIERQQIARLLSETEYTQEQREHDLQLRQTVHVESNHVTCVEESSEGHVINPTTTEDHMTQGDAHMTQEEAGTVNGLADSIDETKVRYYRALYTYDPHHQSPNMDSAEEELAFQEGDIIKCLGAVDNDGFFTGFARGRTGLVPSNMVQELTDPEEIKEMTNQTSNGSHVTGPLADSPRVMRAVHDYDPSLDSPNENSEVELTFSEGDLITVFGGAGEDGYYEGELKGKRGLVPHNFVESPSLDDTEKRKAQLILNTDNVINIKHSD